MTERLLTKPEVRKIATALNGMPATSQESISKAIERLTQEHPALKHPDQQQRVIDKAEGMKRFAETKKRAVNVFVGVLTDHLKEKN